MNLQNAIKTLKGEVCHTSGDGQWSKEIDHPVEIDRVDHYESFMTGRKEHILEVYFTPSTWSVDEQGLIYTDKGWLKAFRRVLRRAGYHSASKVSYTEQGMQGDDYVHLIVGNW